MVVLTSFPPPTEGVIHKEENTEAVLGSENFGLGTLFVAESRVSWLNTTDGRGFSIEYPAITIHAISRDITAYPKECLYLILDCCIDTPVENGENEEEDDDDESSATEIRFVPQDVSQLNRMYKAMCKGQEFHPDVDQSDSDFEDPIDGQFEDADGGRCDDEDDDVEEAREGDGTMYMTPEGQAQLERLSAMLANGQNGRSSGDAPSQPQNGDRPHADEEMPEQ